MIGTIGGATVVGPILMGMRSPVNSLQRTATVDDIVNLDRDHRPAGPEGVLSPAALRARLPRRC